jgi:gamma-glutamyltranspeptidase / glutathione hydrolase
VPTHLPHHPLRPRCHLRSGLLASALLALAACSPSDVPESSARGVGAPGTVAYAVPDQPEMATGYQEKPGWATSEFAVAAANPLATDAGFQVLEAGGTAVDAAIAVQLVLTLVEPQSSGIGGGAFLLHWDGSDVAAYDGREVAPSAAGETLFLREDGSPLPFQEAVASGLSVGVPGTLAMLKVAHEAHGRLPWAELFVPAITLARDGFALSPRLHGLLEGDPHLRNDPLARALYYDATGAPHPVGYNLRNPALAEVLRRVAEEGIPAFYTGAVAQDMVARVQGHPERPGGMVTSDLAAYPAQDFRRTSICTPWRSWTLCGFPPPSSGHLAVMQMLGILEHLEARQGELPGTGAGAGPGSAAPGLVDGLPSAEWLHRYLEAAKLAFADRNRYVADPGFVDPPGGSWESLLDPEYLASRAELVGERSMGTARAGEPGVLVSAAGLHPEQPDAGTSHISIVDAEGNAVSMTTTIESAFGSRIMSDGGTGLPGGFHLNNELTDFSLTPRDAEGNLIANRVEAGKRPRSSMAPTLVFDRETGAFVATVGSPGGAAIIHYVAKALVGMLEWNLNAQEAINLPNFTNANGPSTLEQGRFPAAVLASLRARGHEVREGDLTSGLQGIQALPGGGFFGGADPRREGVVMGR